MARGPEPKGGTPGLRRRLEAWPLVPCGSLHFSRPLCLRVRAWCPRSSPSIPCLVPFPPLRSVLQLRAPRRLHVLCPLPVPPEGLLGLRVSAPLSLPAPTLCSSPLPHSRPAPRSAAFRAASPRGQGPPCARLHVQHPALNHPLKQRPPKQCL